MLCTGWSRGNTCFSYKNNFVYFKHKKVLITQKRRYCNAFLKKVPNYVRKIMSVRRRSSCRTHIRSLSSKSCSNIFCSSAAIYWWTASLSSSIVCGLFVFLPDTYSEPLLKVLLQHILQQCCDLLMNGKFELFNRVWSVRVHSRLEVSPQIR